MDIPWILVIVAVVGVVGVASISRDMRREDASKAERDRLLAMLTEAERREYWGVILEMRRSPEHKAALDRVRNTALGEERKQYEIDIFLRTLREFVEKVEARRARARVDSWDEVWNSLTEEQRAAYHVAADMDAEMAAVDPIGYETAIRYVEFAMNPDWVAANRGPIDHMVRELRERKQEADVIEMGNGLR